MKEELLTIGPLTIYGYGVMIALGVLAAYGTAEYRARKLKMEYDHVFYLIIWCLIGGFACSKLLYWLTEWKSIVQDPAFLLRTMGRRLCGIRRNHWRDFGRISVLPFKEAAFLKFFDLVAPSVALAQGFGRIGCLLAGCCYGRETEGALAITFQNSSFAPNHVALIPTQVYSSLSDFLHFGILIWIARHKRRMGR